MTKIRVMSENLANKIAAGEVVEKCASVLKELVENSIDAGASNIKVVLKDGGLKEISVIDNGVGMDKEDATLAFYRHATSKIYKDDDLYFIETLGFRGEALASIASVSEVELITCNGNVGTSVHIKGGETISVSDASLRVGTEIHVTNLFYNTPARLKYLKSEVTELNNCTGFIEKLALSKPNIAFSLSNNGKMIVKTSGSNNLLKTIHEIYGLNVSSNMLELKCSSDDFSVTGYVSKPSILKKNRNHFNTFVNGRIVKNIEINRAINDAYNTYKHEGFYPIVVINIETDPTLVDVNIHPTKQDIKMSKMEVLTDLLYQNIKKVLYNNLLIPNAIMDEDNNKIKDNFIDLSIKTPDIETKEESDASVIVQTALDIGSENIEPVKNEEFKSLKLYPVGQVHGTYIIAENEDGMFILDQHAAHERVNYEMITKMFQEESISIIDMLVPMKFELSTSDYLAFMDKKSILEELGFKIEEFGINTVIIKSHPTWLKSNYEGDNLKYIIDLVIDSSKNFNKDKFLDSLAKMVSCKMSVKANEHLSMIEMEKLLDDLVKCDNPYNCCHGRPSIMKFTNYELEKMFRRVL